MNESSSTSGRLLGIDFGEARIGLALSDPLGMFAQPYATVENASKQGAKKIAALAAEQGVRIIVLGMPYELDGSIGPQARKVQRFSNRLKSELAAVLDDFELILFDERLTSVQAERMLAGSRLVNSERSSAVDRISAALILESYLSSHPNQGFGQEVF